MEDIYQFHIATLNHAFSIEKMQILIGKFFKDCPANISQNGQQYTVLIQFQLKNQLQVAYWHKYFAQIRSFFSQQKIPYSCSATLFGMNQDIKYQKHSAFTLLNGKMEVKQPYLFTPQDMQDFERFLTTEMPSISSIHSGL